MKGGLLWALSFAYLLLYIIFLDKSYSNEQLLPAKAGKQMGLVYLSDIPFISIRKLTSFLLIFLFIENSVSSNGVSRM